MPEPDFDFAVFGSRPQAVLLALFLAESEGKRVCLVSEPIHPLQVATGIDLSVGPYTRPETLLTLQAARAELFAHFDGLGADLLTRADVAFVARAPAAVDALGHMRHMAAAVGEMTEPLGTAAEGLRGFVVRDARRLRQRPFIAAQHALLETAGIVRFDRAATRLSLASDQVRLETPTDTVTATAAILADDIAAVLPPIETGLSNLPKAIPLTAVLTDPGAGLIWPTLIDLDTGGTALKHPDGRLEAVVAKDMAETNAWLGGFLPTGLKTRLAGRARSMSARAPDGAGLVGPVAEAQVQIAAGLGVSGAFLAPALARFFAGTASASEAAYFSARTPAGDRTNVAEFTADPVWTEAEPA